MGHFTGQRAWMPIEDIVNKQSGVLVGGYCNEFNGHHRECIFNR